MSQYGDVGRTISPHGAGYQLQAVSGTFQGAYFPLNGEVVIGRSNTGCHIHYPENTPGISRRHCSIRVEGGQVLLRDLGSTSGTFLANGTRLTQQADVPLTEGATFYLADTGQMFRLDRAPQAAPQPAVYAQAPPPVIQQPVYVQQPQQPANGDTGSFGWAFLGFMIPIVGLILYLVWKDTKPRNASAAGKGALVSVIAGVIFYIIFAATIGSMFATYF